MEKQIRSSIKDSTGREESSIEELFSRVQDLENSMPIPTPLNTNDVPIKLLGGSATLSDVISTVNELIKRDLKRSRL